MGPDEVARHYREGLIATLLAIKWGIVILVKDPITPIRVVVDDRTRNIEVVDDVQNRLPSIVYR